MVPGARETRETMKTKRLGQHEDETPAEYLRRVVSNLGYEPESILDQLPSVEALLDFFDLWAAYDTDFWAGCMEAIAEGADPKAARDFVAKWKLPSGWGASIDEAEAARVPAAREAE